jgi:hypothetical protein
MQSLQCACIVLFTACIAPNLSCMLHDMLHTWLSCCLLLHAFLLLCAIAAPRGATAWMPWLVSASGACSPNCAHATCAGQLTTDRDGTWLYIYHAIIGGSTPVHIVSANSHQDIIIFYFWQPFNIYTTKKVLLLYVCNMKLDCILSWLFNKQALA